MKDRVWQLLARHRQDTAITTLTLTDQVIEAVGDDARDAVLQLVDEVLANPPSRGKDYMTGWADARDALNRALSR